MNDRHPACDHVYQQVTCDRCGRQYRCTPEDDFYCAAEGDHCCEPCLLGGRSLVWTGTLEELQAHQGEPS